MSAADSSAPSVVQFPDPASRSWRPIRDQLHDWFRAEGIPVDVLDPALDKMGEIYRRLPGGAIPTDADAPTVIEGMKVWVHDIAIHLIAELLRVEIELRQAGLRE